MMVLGQHAGLSLTRPQIRPFGTWVIPSVKEGSPYWSTLWYVQRSFDPARGQISGPRFIDVIRNEPWQQAGPHFDIAVVDADLVDAEPHNVPGIDRAYALTATEPNLACVLSVYRLRRLSDNTDRRLALRRVALQGFGRVLQLPSPQRIESVEDTRGLRHCTNVCLMRDAPDAESALRLAREETAARIMLCRACTNDLLDHVVQTHFSPN